MKRQVLFEIVFGRLATCAVTLRWRPDARTRVGCGKTLRAEPKLMREERRQRPAEARN